MFLKISTVTKENRRAEGKEKNTQELLQKCCMNIIIKKLNIITCIMCSQKFINYILLFKLNFIFQKTLYLLLDYKLFTYVTNLSNLKHQKMQSLHLITVNKISDQCILCVIHLFRTNVRRFNNIWMNFSKIGAN